MRTGMRWMGWGLALAVLGFGSMAQAQYLSPPPAGAPEPLNRLPALPATPAALPGGQPTSLPQANSAPRAATLISTPTISASEAAKESHEEHHEEHHAEHHEEECQQCAIIFDGEFMIVRPFRRNQDYAVVGANPNGGPIGEIKSLDGNVDAGFRVGAAYRFPGEGWQFDAEYMYIHTKESAGAGAPGETVYPTLTFPGIVTAVAGGSASSAVDVNQFDLVLGKRWEASEKLSVRTYAGGRFGYIDEKILATYNGGSILGPTGSDIIHRDMTFGGVGMVIGGEADLKFWEHFSLYAKGNLAIMTGWFHSNLSEVANGVALVNVSEKFDKVVPVADLGVGVSYQFNNLRLSAGYELINYFGLDESIDFSDDTSPGKYNRRASDLGFNGVVFRAELAF